MNNNFLKALHILVNYYEAKEKTFDETLEVRIEKATSLLPEITKVNDASVRWRYMVTMCEALLLAKKDESILSVNYLKDVKKAFFYIVSIGISSNLIAGMLIDYSDEMPAENLSVEERYYRLRDSTKNILSCLKVVLFRSIILVNHLSDLLAALLQLTHAPLKKPNHQNEVDFQMTNSFYNEVMRDRDYFQNELKTLLFHTYLPRMMRELMIFYGNNSAPKWLKLHVYKYLILIVQLENGVESLIKALLDSDALDKGLKWQKCEILVKILLTRPLNVEEDTYYNNICSQLVKLLSKTDRNGKPFAHFEQIVAMCIKYFYEKHKENCYKYLLNAVIFKLTKYANKGTSSSSSSSSSNIILTNEITQTISLWYNCFIEGSGLICPVPYQTLTPIIAILFNLYVVLYKSVFTEFVHKLETILVKYISDVEEEKTILFEAMLFGKRINKYEQIEENLEFQLNADNELELIEHTGKVHLSPLTKSDAVLKLVKCNGKKIVKPLCKYLLEISLNLDENKKPVSNTDLLHMETENDLLIVDELTEKKLVAYCLLSNLTEDETITKHLQDNPASLLKFIESTLKNCIERNVHKSAISDSEQYQSLFVMIMITSIIVENKINHSTEGVQLNDLKNYLNQIHNETANAEMKVLICKICTPEDITTKSNKELSEYASALQDICDPLLPVRGHGLVTLSKLIEAKDVEACANKQYILNICQQQLKNEDSFIYLNAIKVLAALGDTFPDLIVNILCEEYGSSKDLESRLKIGEVLVRVIKSLGEIAVKFKSVLINAFLNGVRDEEPLIRVSSLSNLGEVCRILGFKLGSIVTEVLDCIHGVIATDKAVEARRAAVSVIRGLFIGLDKEIIIFLKDDILPIYLTLKVIYTSDPDDVSRLQAQLALEHLNEIVFDYVFPKVSLEKKIFTL